MAQGFTPGYEHEALERIRRERDVVDVWEIDGETQRALTECGAEIVTTPAGYKKVFFPSVMTTIEHGVYYFVGLYAFYLERGHYTLRREIDGVSLNLLSRGAFADKKS